MQQGAGTRFQVFGVRGRASGGKEKGHKGDDRRKELRKTRNFIESQNVIENKGSRFWKARMFSKTKDLNQKSQNVYENK